MGNRNNLWELMNRHSKDEDTFEVLNGPFGTQTISHSATKFYEIGGSTQRDESCPEAEILEEAIN